MDFTNYRKLMDTLTDSYLPCTDSAVYCGYDEVFRYHNGFADREAGIPLQGDEYFFCYSLSKIFTCTAAMQLLEAGSYQLDDPLCRYLPEYDPRITIRMLFNMRGGFDYDLAFAEEDLDKDTSTRDVLRKLAAKPAVYTPGEHFMYSLCHDVLAAFVEVVSGQKFSDYLDAHIFKPLGMIHTGFTCKEPEKMAAQYRFNEATGHCDRIETVNQYVLSRRYEAGGAGVISTMADLTKFYVTLTNGGTSKDGIRILASETIDKMRTNLLTDAQRVEFETRFPKYKGYGYGLGVRTLLDPAASGVPGSVGEFGWSGAAGAYVLMDPEKKLTLVFLTHALASGRNTVQIKKALYESL